VLAMYGTRVRVTHNSCRPCCACRAWSVLSSPQTEALADVVHRDPTLYLLARVTLVERGASHADTGRS
jgi:hypothetical protein